MPSPRSRPRLSVHAITHTAQFSSAQHSPRPFPLTPSTASDSETESSLPLRHGAITPWQRGLFISHQVKSGFLSLLCGGEIGPQHSKSLMNTMRTEAPAPSRSSLSHASHCPPGAVGWPRRTPASAPSATCGTDRTDRTDRFYAAAGRASSSLSAENRLRMQPQAQGPGGTHRRRRFELIVWVVRPLARKPMSILAFSPQGHSSHLCVQPVTG